MEKQLQAIRGMNDLLPKDSVLWQHVEKVLRDTAEQYGYQEIRFPIVEYTALFKRSIGEVTDIVEKEMYTFDDRNGDSLTLRPEGTACCVRAGLEHGLFYNQTQRLWYSGPMFRHERPQKGRYRQFHQFGAEVFGLAGPDIDAELIFMSARMWKRLGFFHQVELQMNSLGTKETRAAYEQHLTHYFSEHEKMLDEDSQKRLTKNPLRILDSKNPDMQSLILHAPRMTDCLDPESKQHFETLCALLNQAGIRYTINPRLVRGLDYYSKTVFEWVTDKLGAQGAICAGGRFDGLVEQMGGQKTPAIGFALGIERLVALVSELQTNASDCSQADIYFIGVGEAAESAALLIAESLREKLPRRILVNCGGGSFKNQFKKADKSGANIAIILGEEELKTNTASIKFLRENRPQETIEISQLAQYLIHIGGS